jgi:hypothetical protein
VLGRSIDAPDSSRTRCRRSAQQFTRLRDGQPGSCRAEIRREAAATSATTAALRVLELVLPRRVAALALAAGYAGGSFVLLRQALQQLDAAGGGSQCLASEARQAIPGWRPPVVRAVVGS